MIEITLRDLISALVDEGLALVEARPHAYGPANVMPAARLHSALTRRTTPSAKSETEKDVPDVHTDWLESWSIPECERLATLWVRGIDLSAPCDAAAEGSQWRVVMSMLLREVRRLRATSIQTTPATNPTWDQNALVCKGAWELRTACGKCAKCTATKPVPAPAQEVTPPYHRDIWGISHAVASINEAEYIAAFMLDQEPVGLTARQFDLICQAIDKADTITMEGDYMLDSDDCIRVVRVMQALLSTAAFPVKAQVTEQTPADTWVTEPEQGGHYWLALRDCTVSHGYYE